MMSMLWGVFLVALTGSHFGCGLPIGPTPQTYPYDARSSEDAWGVHSLYAAVPALAILITAVGFLLGCTWCYRHKDCKPNHGADNQLFATSATHLHDVSRSNPTDSGFSEPANNNISEDNNNGPISLREMQNIANNNAEAYIVSENEERNRVSRESVIEFEPLPAGIGVADPLERHADWFSGEDFPRNQLQYLREIGRGWFGRVVEGEIEDGDTTSIVAVKILNQNASLEDKARFLEEGRVYRDVRHENVLAFIAKCLVEDPWIMIHELCPMDLQQYLVANRDKMAALNEAGVPLRLLCDVSAALAHLHARGHLYGPVWTGSVLVRGAGDQARAVLGSYVTSEPPVDGVAPEARRNQAMHTASSEVFGVGSLAWQVCAWGQEPPAAPPPPPPIPCLYRNHLYQVMQLCWNPHPEARPTSAQVHALINHLYLSHAHADSADDGYGSSHFEDRWQRLKPNHIPVVDEHVALVHAPSTSTAAHFTGSDTDFHNPSTSLSVDMDTAVSRSSSIMSDKDPLSTQIKSESLTNLHGSLEDVRNIYLTHNELAVLECHQGNIGLEDLDKEHDRSDSSMDPWLKDIIAGSQDDVSYYKDVSDVIKNLDNILNSEKTSSSESSHQASPSRDNLTLDCKKDYPIQSCMVKSPGITNFQSILESGFNSDSQENETCEDDEIDRDTIGTLSHSFERHSDTTSQQTLENITPETPVKDFDIVCNIVCENEDEDVLIEELAYNSDIINEITPMLKKTDLPKENKIVSSDSRIPKLMELCVASIPSVSGEYHEAMNVTQDCKRSCDNNVTDKRTDDNEIEAKSIDEIVQCKTQIEGLTEINASQKCDNVEINNLEVILPKLENTKVSDESEIEPAHIVTENLSQSIDIMVPEQSIGISDDILKVSEISSHNLEKVITGDLTTDILQDSSEDSKIKNEIAVANESLHNFEIQAPETVQNSLNCDKVVATNFTNKIIETSLKSSAHLKSSPEIVQINSSDFINNEIQQCQSEQVIKCETTPQYTNAIRKKEEVLIPQEIAVKENEIITTVQHITDIEKENVITTQHFDSVENDIKKPLQTSAMGNEEIITPMHRVVAEKDEATVPLPTAVTENENVSSLTTTVTEKEKVIVPLHAAVLEKEVTKPLHGIYTEITDITTPPYTNVTEEENVTSLPTTVPEKENVIVPPHAAVIEKEVTTPLPANFTEITDITTPNHTAVTEEENVTTPVPTNVTKKEDITVPLNAAITAKEDVSIPEDTKDSEKEEGTILLHTSITKNEVTVPQQTATIEKDEETTPLHAMVAEIEIVDTPFYTTIPEKGVIIHQQAAAVEKELKSLPTTVIEEETIPLNATVTEKEIVEIPLHTTVIENEEVTIPQHTTVVEKEVATTPLNTNVAEREVTTPQHATAVEKETVATPVLTTVIEKEVTIPQQTIGVEKEVATIPLHTEGEEVTTSQHAIDVKKKGTKPQLDKEETAMEKEEITPQKMHIEKEVTTPQHATDIEIEEKSTPQPTTMVDEDATPQHTTVTDEYTNESTVYMDLINATNSEVAKQPMDEHMKEVIKSCLNSSIGESNCTLVKNESTVYMDLPSMIKETHNFLHCERAVNINIAEIKEICSSTPLGSEKSVDDTLETSVKVNENLTALTETKIPDAPGVTTTIEQRFIPENMSPLESPTKSHHTDTYDENSSVVLGPFENYTLELFKGAKPADLVDLPKEELLAFSSNFSDTNLETPSPLRDARFLHEVPDIIPDFDDIGSISEIKNQEYEPPTESNSNDSQCFSGTEKHISPLTPPNSPGTFLASTSQPNYIVDIDLDPPAGPSHIDPFYIVSESMHKEVDLNQIELQITTKLAMAENENNLNIEYSGPFSIEGVQEDSLLTSDLVPAPEESILAGNGSSMQRKVELDEECVKALRDELELKLPLAQVVNIEPTTSGEWSGSLPPPPELILSYPGALSPIAEETGQQLSAYDNDIAWSVASRTSSSSYPEPCADSPPGSPDRTYTLRRDTSSAPQITMSADSLNASPLKRALKDSADVTIDDKTYTKQDDDKFSNCERISQVSPFILSPTTESSAPDNSDNVDNATGVSTLSKTTVPTDAKPSEIQCLSKATSIDSWCSNDTLYNVEENFDDLAMDPDVPNDFEQKDEEHSESSHTLTHDDDKELSHCSTYIIHDSKSEPCDTFSPDSITANDNYTYTKARTEVAETTPSIVTKSDLDSTKNSQTKDLAYGTLMSGLPSYSNCTTEAASAFDNVWKFQQPELIRRSPMAEELNTTQLQFQEDKDVALTDAPQITAQPKIKKMDSVEMSCLHDNLVESPERAGTAEVQNSLVEVSDKESPDNQYKNMAPSLTSTPLTEILPDVENIEPIHMELPTTSEIAEISLPNFQIFSQSAEVRPQDISPRINNAGDTISEILLEGDSHTFSKNSNRDSLVVDDRTPNYSDFENSAFVKPQDVHSRDESSQSIESGMNSEEFRRFENSVRHCPQDMSSVIDASSLLLNSERRFSELATSNTRSVDLEQTSQSESQVNNIEPMQALDVSPPNINLVESQHVEDTGVPSEVYTDVDGMEAEQPHSIIITENDVLIKESPNRTFDSHNDAMQLDFNHTYDSHESRSKGNKPTSEKVEHATVNGTHNTTDTPSPRVEDLVTLIDLRSEENARDNILDLNSPNTYSEPKSSDEIKCNGKSEKFATVQFLNETFEELIESNVDDGDIKDFPNDISEASQQKSQVTENSSKGKVCDVSKEMMLVDVGDSEHSTPEMKTNGVHESEDDNLATVTESFLQNEKFFCQLDSYLPLLSDIRFTGPASEIMSTSFTQDSPTDPTSPETERDSKHDVAADILKEWDSDSDTHSTNSSSGEFIWKQRENGGGSNGNDANTGAEGPSEASGDSGSGSEGDEVEFVPSSWDCRAAPAKSSLRSLEQATQDSKKRVVFKRQKYHCVYEYPREAIEVDAHSPAYVPDLSTYSEWDPSSAEEAELGYGQLFGAPSPLDLYPLRPALAYDYDEDFFISSSARPFESLGIMSTASQFFPGMHAKAGLIPRDTPDEPDGFPPPPDPLPAATFIPTRTPSLDFTTPDSGVEDITPGSTTEDFKDKVPEEITPCWRPVDSGSSSESVSPSSPGGEALGGLRHTRDKLKLDLPPSPHIPSPRHNRVFNFVLDKPKRHRITEEKIEIGTTPLVMTDETPIVSSALPLDKDCEEMDLPLPEPTFSTFGKCTQKPEPEQKIILTDEMEESSSEVKVESPKVVEPVKGEGTVLDSGDEDSGIESSSKATLERNSTNNVS